MTEKLELKKETIRFFKDDVDLIREHFPGGYGQLGINEVIRTIVHSWTNKELRGQSTSEA